MNPLDLWTAPDVLAMLERQGWPEWAVSRGDWRRLWRDGHWQIFSSAADSCVSDRVNDRVVLALLRDDSRERLERVPSYIIPAKMFRHNCAADLYLVWSPDHHYLQADGRWNEDAVPFEYDAALIAGRKAMER